MKFHSNQSSVVFFFFLFSLLIFIPIGYAYSFRANELITGYTREVYPICYGWKDSSSDSSSSSSSSSENEITKDPTDCEPIGNISNGQVIIIFELFL